jgi:flagellar basal-body rod protein FlgC
MKVDNMFGPIDIALSGLKAQNKQMEIISSNVTNARTTDAGKGEPYRRLMATFKADGDGISGVSVTDVQPDMSDFIQSYDPGNPDADEQGYVSMPNVNLPTEMMNLTVATRIYQTNAAMLKRYQQMIEATLELLR